MKILLSILFVCITFNAISQENSKEDTIYNIKSLDVKPDFPGGLEQFFRYVKSNFKTTDKNLKGKVFVTFIIEKDGTLSNIKVIRDIGQGTAEEAIRVMKESPKWIPGQIGGANVRSLFSIPITVNFPF